MTTTIHTTIPVLTDRLDDALAALKKISKKAKRYGVPFSAFKAPARMDEVEYTDREGRTRKYRVSVTPITIAGEKPVVGDYEFVASIEHTDSGNFVDCVPGAEVPERYRTTASHCDHCHTSRQRKNTFVVRSQTDGSFMQVGRSCLRDFLGTDNPEHILSLFAILRDIEESRGGWCDLGRAGATWSDEVVNILAVSLAAIRVWGWVSKGQAMGDPTDQLVSTVSRYWDAVTPKPSKEQAEVQAKIREASKEDDTDTASEILAWVRGSNETSDYMWNLRLACADDIAASPKRVGLIVSAVAAWHRHQDRELKKAQDRELNAASEWQGEIGARLRSIKVRLEMRRGLGEGAYGWTELLKLRDEAGNLYTWFTGSEPKIDVGETLLITGTVKDHKEYQGIKETLLTRVKVEG